MVKSNIPNLNKAIQARKLEAATRARIQLEASQAKDPARKAELAALLALSK